MRLTFVAMLVTPALLLALPAMALRREALAALPADRTTWDSVFTVEQAARGEIAYEATCAKCHQQSLSGADAAPALAGGTFLGNWNGLSIAELHDRVRQTMPPADPGKYGRQHVTDVIAYMLSVNGFPAGRAELPVEAASLQGIRILATRP